MAITRDFIVAYDICAPKRLRRVHRTMLGFGQAIQYSVFYCQCSPAQIHAMKLVLADLIDPREDQVIFVDLGFQTLRLDTITSLGCARTRQTREAIVV